MSQPYPGPQGPYPGYPAGQYPPYPAVVAAPKYRPLRRIALISIGLMGLTAVAAVVQVVLMWSSYDDVKRFVYGLVSEDEFDSGIESITNSGPLLDLVGYLFVGTAIAFLIWLWQARENTQVFRPIPPGGFDSHRHTQGWVVGSWICPIVQFWYPLEVVEDVVQASEPPAQPGAAKSGEVRALLYGWWAAWTGFWVILVAGGATVLISFVVWIVQLVDRADAAGATGDYVDIYDLQDDMVRVALGVNIGFTVAIALLIAAAVTVSLLLLRVSTWQDTRGAELGLLHPGQPPATPVTYPQPPQYAPRPTYTSQPGFGPPPSQQPGNAPRSFPSYGAQPHPGGQPPPGRPTNPGESTSGARQQPPGSRSWTPPG
ncbi:uncharacterized protein DUF4328 [Kribbella orskensis]|uniref:Uncharacterized protein DUF4328 n=1 Tax=Kribbella orskensis TaxID=2512216 RepID=A0ABY2BPT6_9ACTN|nr:MULTISPECIES: DUF4328 domain-containing protein [Kribbella]TCN39581.1 uncharacterized protein DUF4328 [Kribbella sp. VKM Ac-2500]TCO27637.1 uncharacterized protein DUF4328 [Kribbella orskensis]